MRSERTPAYHIPPHPGRHPARTRALDLCRHALGIVVLVVVVGTRGALQLPLRMQLSGWGVWIVLANRERVYRAAQEASIQLA
jgi:hypothetical protein